MSKGPRRRRSMKGSTCTPSSRSSIWSIGMKSAHATCTGLTAGTGTAPIHITAMATGDIRPGTTAMAVHSGVRTGCIHIRIIRILTITGAAAASAAAAASPHRRLRRAPRRRIISGNLTPMARPSSSSLRRYHAKRDFARTPEPSGEQESRKQAAASGGQRLFVIQKHAASRLHYDFRLELDGTLKSWAVPKGPSLDPSQKRLAVHVEDHPLDYANFEGIIPPKQYGAGTVLIWDRGTWHPEGDPRESYRRGVLKFRLDGQKLHGAWTLVRMQHRREKERENGKENW